MTPRLYTEIRIAHKSEKQKKEFEKELDYILDTMGYESRSEWVREYHRKALERLGLIKNTLDAKKVIDHLHWLREKTDYETQKDRWRAINEIMEAVLRHEFD